MGTRENSITDVHINLLNTGAAPVIIVGAFLSSADPVHSSTLPASTLAMIDTGGRGRGKKRGSGKKDKKNKNKKNKKNKRGDSNGEDSWSGSGGQMVVPPGLNSQVKQGKLVFQRGTPLPVGQNVKNALTLRINARHRGASSGKIIVMTNESNPAQARIEVPYECRIEFGTLHVSVGMAAGGGGWETLMATHDQGGALAIHNHNGAMDGVDTSKTTSKKAGKNKKSKKGKKSSMSTSTI